MNGICRCHSEAKTPLFSLHSFNRSLILDVFGLNCSFLYVSLRFLEFLADTVKFYWTGLMDGIKKLENVLC